MSFLYIHTNDVLKGVLKPQPPAAPAAAGIAAFLMSKAALLPDGESASTWPGGDSGSTGDDESDRLAVPPPASRASRVPSRVCRLASPSGGVPVAGAPPPS
jgi:hypothetical protein